VPKWKVSGKDQREKRSILGEIDTCPFFLIKKGFFGGRVNFETIGPK